MYSKPVSTPHRFGFFRGMKVIATDLTDTAVELYSHKVNMIFFLLLRVFKVKSRNNQPENLSEP